MATNRIWHLRERKETLLAGLDALQASAGDRVFTAAETEHFDRDMGEVKAISAEIGRHEELIAEQERIVNRDGPSSGFVGAGGKQGEDDDRPALSAVPPLSARTRKKLASLAGGASSPVSARRENWAAVVTAAMGGNPFHASLVPQAGTGTEGVQTDGGFAVRPDVSSDIFARAAEQSLWIRLGARVETMISDEKLVVALDDDDESADKEAALQAGWTGEGVDLTPQVMQLRAVTLRARKLMVVAASSNELGEDSTTYLNSLQDAVSRAIAKKFDRAVLSGTGAGQPLGLLNAPATIEVSKTVDSDPGTANKITWLQVTNMLARLAPSSYENAYWLVHPSTLPQLFQMVMLIKNVAATENVGGSVPGAAFQAGGPTGYQMLGRPVVITSRVKPLSSRGDIMLVDPTQVAVGIRSGITIDRSPHVYFTSDRLAIRGKFRADAAPLWETPRTLQEGSTTVSPYVVLQAR